MSDYDSYESLSSESRSSDSDWLPDKPKAAKKHLKKTLKKDLKRTATKNKPVIDCDNDDDLLGVDETDTDVPDQADVPDNRFQCKRKAKTYYFSFHFYQYLTN